MASNNHLPPELDHHDPEDEKEGYEVDLNFDEMGEDDEPFEYDVISKNLVRTFSMHPVGREALDRLADKVCSDFDAAWKSNTEYRDRYARDLKLYMGHLGKKDFPFENCANMHVPIYLENISRLGNRMIAEIFGDWTNVFSVVPVGPDDRDAADVMTKHGNWQLVEQVPDFARQMERTLLLFLTAGSAVTYSYFDEEREVNRHVALTPDDFVMPYTHVTTCTDLSDVPYHVRILRLNRTELEMRMDWENVHKVIGNGESMDGEPDSPVRTSAAEVEGIEPDMGMDVYKILHYEGWLKLPLQGKPRWCKVMVDHGTRAILSLSVHEETDWRDKQRHDQQWAELNQYRAASTYHEQNVAMYESSLQENLDDVLDPETAAAVAQAPRPVPPPPPSWQSSPNDVPTEVKMVPIRMFAHGVCLENLGGANGISFGRVQADYNRAANTMMSQSIDAQTLANTFSFVVKAGVKFEGGLNMAPGAINTLEGYSTDSIDQNIMQMQPGAANPQMLDSVNRAIEWSRGAIQAPEVLSGEAGKSGETARGLGARIEQATKQISVIARKFVLTMLQQVLRNNAALNARYMDEKEVEKVMNHKLGIMEEVHLGRDLYRRDYRTTFRSDLRFTSNAQRVEEAKSMLMLPQVSPLLADPIYGAAYRHEALRRYFEASGNDDMIPLIGPKPPTPTEPYLPQPPMPEGPPQPGAPPQGPPQQ